MWTEAQQQTIGVPNDVKRLNTRTKAEDFVVSTVRLGQPPPPNPAATLFTDGSASNKATASAGWRVHVCQFDLSMTGIWGPVLTDPHDSDLIGALRPTNNTCLLSCPSLDPLHSDQR